MSGYPWAGAEPIVPSWDDNAPQPIVPGSGYDYSDVEDHGDGFPRSPAGISPTGLPFPRMHPYMIDETTEDGDESPDNTALYAVCAAALLVAVAVEISRRSGNG
jgi:hypothetical protein